MGSWKKYVLDPRAKRYNDEKVDKRCLLDKFMNEVKEKVEQDVVLRFTVCSFCGRAIPVEFHGSRKFCNERCKSNFWNNKNKEGVE